MLNLGVSSRIGIIRGWEQGIVLHSVARLASRISVRLVIGLLVWSLSSIVVSHGLLLSGLASLLLNHFRCLEGEIPI